MKDARMPTDTSELDASRVVWIIGALAVAVAAVLTFENPWLYVSDDSLFYLVVGRSIADGSGVTFNGLMPTNGVQPLWQVVLAGLCWVLDLFGIESSLALVRAAVLVNWALASLALIQLWRLLRALGLGGLASQVGVVVLGLALGGPLGLFVSEAHLLGLLVVTLLLQLVRLLAGSGPGWQASLAFGAFAGLVCLARLDTIWFVLTAFGILTVDLARRGAGLRDLRWVVVAGATTTVIVGPYLLWNRVRFGQIVPISGAIKTASTPQFNLTSAGYVALALLVVIWMVGIVVMLRASTPRLRRQVWLSCAIGASLSTGWYITFSYGTFTNYHWYLVVHFVGVALVAAQAAEMLASTAVGPTPRWRPLLVTAGTASALLLGVAAVLGIYTRPGPEAWAVGNVHLVDAIARHVPPDARIATVDAPGIVALESGGRPVVALDGLTGDFDFQRNLRDHGVECELARLDVTWLISETAADVVAIEGGAPGEQGLYFASWLFREPATVIRVDPGAEVDMPATVQGFRLWEISPSCS